MTRDYDRTPRTVTRSATFVEEIGEVVGGLISSYKHLDVETIRIQKSVLNTYEITGRIGTHQTSKCPRCDGFWHTPNGECIDNRRPNHATKEQRENCLKVARNTLHGGPEQVTRE